MHCNHCILPSSRSAVVYTAVTGGEDGGQGSPITLIPTFPLQGRHCAGLALIPHPANLQEFLIDKTSCTYTLYLTPPDAHNMAYVM